MELSTIKEVLSTDDGQRDAINKRLAGRKWVLLDVKIVDTQYFLCEDQTRGVRKDHLKKDYEVVYVIGRIK